MCWACPRNTARCAHTHTHTHTHKQKLISTGEIQWPAALLGALSSAHLASNRPMNLLTANISFTLEGKIKGYQQSTKVQAAVDVQAKARVTGIMNVCSNLPNQSTLNWIKIKVNAKEGDIISLIGSLACYRCSHVIPMMWKWKWRTIDDVTANHLVKQTTVT